ncbi:MAG: hypothetical protein JXQ82_01295 [Methanomicrobiaceae archaeon]|nr:hypothetical protein [Methanomicrobiaceae archaeon]
MDKRIIIAIISIPVILLLIFGLLSLLAGDICPPPGWQGPRPPWCEAPEVGGAFQYQELDYISETYPDTYKVLITGIGTMDMWGNPHVVIDLGEDPAKNMESTMQRIGSIRSEAVFVTDFTMFDENFDVTYVPESVIPSAITISQDELNQIVAAARANNQQMVMMVTALYDPMYTFVSVTGGDAGSTARGTLLSADDATKIQYFNKLWPGWKEKILEQADKAEAAGIDYMTINPGDQSFEWIVDTETMDEKYSELIPEVRKRFSGKIGLLGMLPYISKFDAVKNVDFVLIQWDPNGDYTGRDIFADTNNDDIDDIEASFTEWLSRPEWKQFAGNEVYVSVTLPSYTGALQEGWIEPKIGEFGNWNMDYKEQALGYEGLFRAIYDGNYDIAGVFSYGYWWSDQIYPVSKDLPNHIMHSIRQKDAENVFYKWSQVFS